MFFPIYLLSAAGFTVLTTEFVIVGLLPAIAGEVGACSELAGRLAPDDLLDAAVVAWSAARARTGEARRFGRGALQRDPELDREILIHA